MMRLPRGLAPRSNDEYIERLRRNVAQFDRWRPWILGLYGIAAVLFFAGLFMCVVIFERVGLLAQLPLRWHGLLLGIVIGASIGVSAIKIAHGLGSMLFGLRNERLLVRYYDEVCKIRESIETEECDESGAVDLADDRVLG
jgi:hypothetical protein